jgi:hypothetical protein
MSINTMKAVRLHQFGGPEVLRYEDAPTPELKPGEVLVRVHAIGINPPDWYLREGYKMLPPEWRPPVPLPVIPGTDISGVIAELAPDVKGFSVGDEVFGMVRFPSFGQSAAYAEYVAAPAFELAPKPAGIDHVHAAGAPMSGLTAWQFLVELGHNEPNPLQPDMHRPGVWGTSPCRWRNVRGRRASSPWPRARMSHSCANSALMNSSTIPSAHPKRSRMTWISSSTHSVVHRPAVSCAPSSVAARCSRCS